MLTAAWKKNDKKARILIFTFSIVVFLLVTALSRVSIDVDLGFDVHIFAAINAVINTCVSLLLLAALMAVKGKRYLVHKRLMLAYTKD